MTKNAENNKCPLNITLGLIGGKYKTIILWYLYSNKIMRFSELQKMISKITPKMLIQQLKQLEADSLITRTVYPVVPPKVEYSLTDLGKTIIPILESMNDWGKKYIDTVKK